MRHDSRREIITCLFGRTIRAQLQPCQFVPTKLMIYYRPIKHFIWNNFIILFTKQSSQKTKLKKTRKSTLWSVYYRQSLIKRPWLKVLFWSRGAEPGGSLHLLKPPPTPAVQSSGPATDNGMLNLVSQIIAVKADKDLSWNVKCVLRRVWGGEMYKMIKYADLKFEFCIHKV